MENGAWGTDVLSWLIMRWDNLLAGQDETETAALPLLAGEAVVRRFKTPQFQGMTFYEVAAKSIINHVPGDRYGFSWTINPYRGCSHACSYCLAGDTAVLMAGAGTRPLKDLRPGDAIYGTEAVGNRRRFVRTRVLDQWTSVRPAFRVVLADATVLIASAQHRFLAGQGWIHVAGAERGPGHRPQLTRGMKLVGAGGFAQRPAPEAGDGVAAGGDGLLEVVSVEPLGLDMTLYDITTGTGDFIANGVVSHNCFARPTHTYLDFDAGRDFETRIVVKVNAAERLRRELRRPSWPGELIAMGTNTDPYQRAEGHYRLMRGILSELNAARNPYSILTKGTLIRRDLDLLQQGAAVTGVSANFSVGTVDEAVWEASEPGTPHPMKRLEVVRMLNDAGIPCGVLMAPILPGISDSPEQLEATVRAAAQAGATHVTPITLHLRKGVKEEFLPWLAEHYPDLVARYGTVYKRPNAPREVSEPIGRAVADLRRRLGVTQTRNTGARGTPPPAVSPGSPPDDAHEAAQGRAQGIGQLSLDLEATPSRRAPNLLLRTPGRQPAS